MILFSIREMERLSTVKCEIIRIWEKRYNFFSPVRKNGIRQYALADLQKLFVISSLYKNGFKLHVLGTWDFEQMLRKKDTMILTTEEHCKLIVNELILLMYAQDPEGFDLVLDKAVQLVGLDNVMVKVVASFLSRTFLFWRGNLLTQEHFVVMLLRKKIMVAIDQIVPTYTIGRVALLYLLSGKQLDLGLLYANYILKKNGWKVFNVGRDLSCENLSDYCRIVSPDILFTYSSFRNKQEAEIISDALYQNLPESMIITALYPENKLPVYNFQNILHQHYNTVLHDLCSNKQVV